MAKWLSSAALAAVLLQADDPKIAEEVRILNDPAKPTLQVQASMKLEKRGAAAVPALLAFVKAKGHNALSLLGTELFCRIEDPRLADLAAQLLADRDFYWRPMAMQALAAQKSKNHLEVYRAGLKDRLWGVRAAAALGLENVDDRASLADVKKLLGDETYDVRAQAAKTLYAWGDPSGLPVLVEALRSNVQWFDIDYGQIAREDAWSFLVRITWDPAKHQKALLEAFRAKEKREPDTKELDALGREARTLAKEEASLGFKPWEGEKAREGGLARWDAWMASKDPSWREKIPEKARVKPDTSEYAFGFELRSCQIGDFFFRLDTEDNLVLGYFNLERAKLTPEEKRRFDEALKLVRETDRSAPYGEGGCDFEQYYLREGEGRFAKLWIGRRGRPPELDGFIRTCEQLIKAKFGPAEASDFKERTALFRGPD
jgi:hypothetical protein